MNRVDAGRATNDAWRYRGGTQSGRHLRCPGRMGEGVALLHRALAGEPDFPPALAVLAFYSITTGDEAVAREWMLRARRQVRLPRAQLQTLIAQYRQQFGHEPW